MNRFASSVLVLALLTTACGPSEEEKRAEEAARAAEETAQSAEAAAESAAQSLEQMAKGFEQLAKGGSATVDGKPVEPVRFQDLIDVLPQLDGWEQQKPTGERMTSPFPTANAKATYTKDDATINVEVVDSTFSQLLIAPVAMFLQSGYSTESTSGYEKSVTVNGQPGWEKWNSDTKSAEVHALVGKRFIVSVEGSNVENPEQLRDVASKMDFNRLANLK